MRTRTRTKKKKRTGFILVICLLLAVFLAAFLLLAKKYAPSRKVLPLTEFYSVEDGEILVVMQDQVMEERGKLIGDRIYLKYEQITDVLNKRFYWDQNENLLIYTTASSVIKAEPGRKTYQINKNSKETDYDIVSLDGDNVYIALDFVRLYTDLSYQVYEEPQRVVITYRYGEELLYTVSKRKTQIRKKAGIKSDVLATVPSGSRLACLDKDGEEINGFIHVITEDGVTGYISSRKAEKPYSTVLESKNGFQEESYSHIRKDGKINMAWHQVFNQDANNQLSSLLEHTEGITTISPTWFRITGENGDITSIASESYVEKAHSMGIEVWALVSDVDEKVDMGNILSYTEKREKIEKELLSQAIRYDIDGINIDFETISKDCAASYLQFIRELSIRCRKNDIVLSIDTYVPTEYSAYYDRAEQASVADYVIIMGYDEHYVGGGESGSVASIGFVRDAIQNSLKEIPAEQLILGIPFYTRLWKETEAEDGTLSITAENYGMESSFKKMDEVGVTPVWQEETGQYYGEYKSEGATYKIWLEEETSIEEKVKLAHENALAGISAWKLGMEKEEVWNVIQKYS